VRVNAEAAGDLQRHAHNPRIALKLSNRGSDDVPWPFLGWK
jgi:hypothetical protein